MEGILAQVGSLDYAGMLAQVWDFVAGLDRDWQIMGGGALCLLLLGRMVRRHLAATAEHRALRRQYKKLAKAGVAEWERPFRLFSGREGWDFLPDEFLMELTSRLIDRDRVIDFIVLSEEFEQELLPQFAQLAKSDPDKAMRRLSTFLTDFADGLPAPKMIAMLGFAAQVDPENHWALIDLATAHYAAKRFAEALPLLEQAIPLGQQAQVELPRNNSPGRAVAARSPRLTMEMMRSILKVAGEMYEDCAKRVGPKLT